MGKFGKRNVVSSKITDYNIAILGVSGIGKTTLMVNVCEKLVGDSGYIILNVGKEDGISCIDGAVYENIEKWKKFEEVVNDIIKNKATEYPDLKVVVIDTIDQLFDLAEQETIRRYNIEKNGEKGFKPAATINGAYGGFGAGLDYATKLILDKVWELKSAGVAVWMCGHTKNKDIVDPLTEQTYTTISANLSQRYFNAIKTKMHIIGMAVIDRDIITESTGRKNIVTHQDITKNKIISEARKIVFRDDNYGVDSKSRFAGIVEEIPLDADAFIKAVTDAIYNAKKEETEKKAPTPVIVSAPTPAPVVEEPKKADSFSGAMNEPEPVEEKVEEVDDLDDDIDDIFPEAEVEDTRTDNQLREEIRQKNRTAAPDVKAAVKAFIAPYGKLADVDRAGLLKLIKMF